MNRRTNLILMAVAALTAWLNAAAGAVADAELKDHVSRADITYDKPVTRSEEGLPIGNGRMGSLVWTTPSALKFQINRPDVFANDSSTTSFNTRHTDYGSGCGYVDIDLVDYGDDVFAGGGFRQHLSVYDGLVTVEGNGVTARVLAWNKRDVFAVEIEDHRPQPTPINIDLRMLRYVRQYIGGQDYELAKNRAVMVRTRNHTATSRLDIRDGCILLTQVFREGKFYDASALAIGASGRPCKAKYLNESTVRLALAPGPGRCTILISSAASFKTDDDVGALALQEMAAARGLQFADFLRDNDAWWRDFWSRGFVHMHSADGVADEIEQNYTYYLYLMASSSRGAYPPRYGGLVWYSNGDMREWGAMHWWANSGCYYNGLPPANRLELLDPVFSMYSGMYESCARAASQVWGSKGIFIPETTYFDGPEALPEDVAAEMRELYLGRKPWEQRSERFLDYASLKLPHNSLWNWIAAQRLVDGRRVLIDKGRGPRGHVLHIFSSGAKIAHLYWQRYEYTQDKTWLRDRAYPMLKGVAEFYRNYPNLKKGTDGRYHIYDVNNHEPLWGATDTMEEVAAMRGILPILLRASRILGTDEVMRPVWQEFADHLPLLPTSDMPGAITEWQPGQPRTWADGLKPVFGGVGQKGGRSLVPALFYDLCTVETGSPEMLQVTQSTFDADHRAADGAKKPLHVLSHEATAAANLGRADAVKWMIPSQLRGEDAEHDFCDWQGVGKVGVLPNRLTLREGPGAIDAQRLGRAAEALHLALLQSSPPAPGGDPVIHVFPAWPVEWDADYSLLARGAFVVNASMAKGRIGAVRIQSQAGGECRLRNPWPGSSVMLYRNGKKSEELKGALLTFPTQRGEAIDVTTNQL